MITPERANELNEDELQRVMELEVQIDGQLRNSYAPSRSYERRYEISVAVGAPMSKRISNEVVARYKHYWDIDYEPNRVGGSVVGHFRIAEKRG